MQLINRADDYTSDDPTLNPPIIEGQANPMRRDTVHVPSGSSVTLRVVADNPGVWFFHCMSCLLLLPFPFPFPPRPPRPRPQGSRPILSPPSSCIHPILFPEPEMICLTFHPSSRPHRMAPRSRPRRNLHRSPPNRPIPRLERLRPILHRSITLCSERTVRDARVRDERECGGQGEYDGFGGVA